ANATVAYCFGQRANGLVISASVDSVDSDAQKRSVGSSLAERLQIDHIFSISGVACCLVRGRKGRESR
ncbi:MAG: hypothetical protein MUO33_10825, partial [Sedimentisphaerales bacterium]|nr:hypothetical protein [Sedimentisphaerales bacterium]